MQQTTQSAIVVMEEGSQWPGWLARFEPIVPTTVVISQQLDEAPAALAQRLANRLADPLRRQGPVDLAVIACNERHDPVVDQSRRQMARVLLGQMKAPDGQLLFTESQRQSGGARAALSALATDLAREWQDNGVTVSVRFGQPSRPPQAIRSTAPR